MLDNKVKGERFMGMSASQARFLQLTARQSNCEYQAQRINFERLELSDQLSQASSEYNDKTSNRALKFSFSNGNGTQSVDVSYKNYKNYMNKQLDGLTSASQQYFLVSSSGNKIVVGSDEDKMKMMQSNLDENGNSKFTESDFMIVENLDDNDRFQKDIEEGVYYFATLRQDDDPEDPTGNSQKYSFDTSEWSNIGELSQVLDESDDKEAEAKYDALKTSIQRKDKKMEMQLNQLETERNSITNEIEAVQKVIDDNIEASFKVFS